jgi:hypothetical protein
MVNKNPSSGLLLQSQVHPVLRPSCLLRVLPSPEVFDFATGCPVPET